MSSSAEATAEGSAAASSSAGPLCLVRSSINIDSMFAVPHVVRPGETISSSKMVEKPGGKGANVSAAVALAEQPVVMSGAVGKDATWPIDELKKRGVQTGSIRQLETIPTGRAFIQVAEDGENSIVLLKGANFASDEGADEPKKVFASLHQRPTHLIVQNEIPLPTTKAFLRHANHTQESSSSKCATVFNPSPMLTKEQLQDFAWDCVDVLIVNEGEGQDLLGAMGKTKDPSPLEDTLNELGGLYALRHTAWIVLTRGSRGVSALVRTGGQGTQASANRERLDVPAATPRAVRDTTGAGDTFAGNLVAGLMRAHASGKNLESLDEAAAREVLQVAAVAAAMAVEVDGAMESIPRFADVQERQRGA